ncbi:MAG: hypothetical protein IIA27_16555 [Gemmatimonadetes bacterium]|nr:hypothetical protein [Gemmatimonadota bacterium]
MPRSWRWDSATRPVHPDGGSVFSGRAGGCAGAPLVTDGVFKVVRHPSDTGTLCLVISGEILLSSPARVPAFIPQLRIAPPSLKTPHAFSTRCSILRKRQVKPSA